MPTFSDIPVETLSTYVLPYLPFYTFFDAANTLRLVTGKMDLTILEGVVTFNLGGNAYTVSYLQFFTILRLLNNAMLDPVNTMRFRDIKNRLYQGSISALGAGLIELVSIEEQREIRPNVLTYLTWFTEGSMSPQLYMRFGIHTLAVQKWVINGWVTLQALAEGPLSTEQIEQLQDLRDETEAALIQRRIHQILGSTIAPAVIEELPDEEPVPPPDSPLQKQKKILIALLESVKATSSVPVIQEIDNSMRSLVTAIDMKGVIASTNLLIATLENREDASSTLSFLKKKGLFRMLYRHAKYLGEELPDQDPLRQLLRSGFIGVGIALLLIAAFLTTMLLHAPFWLVAISTGLFVGASVYLSGLLYGVVNDLFATQSNLPYFLLGHQPQQKSLLRTNDKVAQGVAWGVSATYILVLAAAIVFTIGTMITAFFVPIATFILPAITLLLLLVAVGAEIYARIKTKQYSQMEKKSLDVGSNFYQKNGLRFMSPTKKEQAAWYANGERNMFGFTKVPLIGLVALISLLVLSGVSMFLAPVLFTSIWVAVIAPAIVSGITGLTLGAAGVYAYVNRNKQVDDRTHLEFNAPAVNYDLYLEPKDEPEINRLFETHRETFTRLFEPAPAPARMEINTAPAL